MFFKLIRKPAHRHNIGLTEITLYLLAETDLQLGLISVSCSEKSKIVRREYPDSTKKIGESFQIIINVPKRSEETLVIRYNGIDVIKLCDTNFNKKSLNPRWRPVEGDALG